MLYMYDDRPTVSEQLVECCGGSRRAWWPYCGGARFWVRPPPPTPTRRPSFRGVVPAPVRKAGLPPRN